MLQASLRSPTISNQQPSLVIWSDRSISALIYITFKLQRRIF
ncbi:hypothetical protein [Tolypothrix sp. PCC 7910]|nr:hypothetical protein [Tolypothrix sp. PCC 7910]